MGKPSGQGWAPLVLRCARLHVDFVLDTMRWIGGAMLWGKARDENRKEMNYAKAYAVDQAKRDLIDP
jgi:hypothetical protein